MQLSIEILDHIFSFLVPHRKTLIACLTDPVLSPIVERHLYYHIIVDISGKTNSIHYKMDHLCNLISENPHILYYVRILQIQAEYDHRPWRKYSSDMELLGVFANTLLKFPVLESIILTAEYPDWTWPLLIRAALEDRLNLPTVKELHLVGGHTSYFSFLDNCKNIRKLTLSGLPITQGQFRPSSLPQLHSLSLLTPIKSSSLLDWVKLHINELRSLKYPLSLWEEFFELLGVCSGTLNTLDVNLDRESQCMVQFSFDRHDATLKLDYTVYSFLTGETNINPLPKFYSIPLKLQQLTIRTAVDLEFLDEETPQYLSTWLPAAAELITLFISSLQHLILDVNLYISAAPDFTKIDFSPLEILGAASLSIPRIDLYVQTGILSPARTLGRLLSSLEKYEGITRSIKEGVLIIHPEKTAPVVE